MVNINEVGKDENIAATQYREIRLKTMWPAVMLAASRNDRVIGRTKILVVSMRTRNGFSHSGAPSGRKWAVDFFVECENDEINILIQSGRPIDRVRSRCLDDEIEYGIIPIKLTEISRMNRLDSVIGSPFMWIDMVRDSCDIMNVDGGTSSEISRLFFFHNLS